MKYLIYARKSSEDEDRQILSIDSQIKELKDIAKKRGLEIIGILEESKSAKAPGRPIFDKMIAKFHKGEVDGIMCWKIDRLARNPVDGGQISWLLQTEVIKSIQTSEKEYLPADNVILMNLEFGVANQFIRDLITNCKRGLRAKAESGWFPMMAPIGYLNNPLEKTIIKDQERFGLVRQMFDMVLEKNYPVAKIGRIVIDDWKLTSPKRKKRGGTIISNSSLYRILTNPFYYGWFEYGGKLYKGKHEPMLTHDDFWKVQKMLGERGRPQPHLHEFAYTGMIRCSECGSMITAEESVRYNKTDSGVRHYVYYRCSKKKRGIKCLQPYIPKEKLEKQVAKFLEKIKLDTEFMDLTFQYAQKVNQDEGDQRVAIYQSLHSAKETNQKQINNLIDMRAKDLITEEEYVERRKKLTFEQARINEKLGDADYDSKNWLELMEDLYNFCKHVVYWFNNGTLEDKKIILRTIGSNLMLKDKILYFEPRSVFLEVAQGVKNDDWQGEGWSKLLWHKFLQHSGFVVQED